MMNYLIRAIWALFLNATEQYDLGKKHAEGNGVPMNYEEAIEWYRRAADLDHALAQYELGDLYYWGLHVVPKDKREAVKWFRKAAEQGYALAQYKLGDIYYWGLDGDPKDHEEAAKWFRKAAEQGDKNAQNRLGEMLSSVAIMSSISKNDGEAVKWYRKAAEQGHDGAQASLGNAYSFGNGVPKDDEEAAKWYRKAAEQGYGKAQDVLDRGKGVPSDKKGSCFKCGKSLRQVDTSGKITIGGGEMHTAELRCESCRI